jgi:hypothetical protein
MTGIKFYNYDGNLHETMRIDGNGYLGIGTSTPNYRLDVNGSINAFSYYGDGGLLSNIASQGFTQPLANLVVSNSVTTTNIFAARVGVNTKSSLGQSSRRRKHLCE